MTNKLWGGRFADSPNAQMRALQDSISFDKVLYAADIHGSVAYAWALSRADILTEQEAQMIEHGLEKILEEFETEQFQYTEGDEDIHTAVERRLTEIVGAVAGKLHTGRSRNDQIATDIRLWLRDTCSQVEGMLINIQTVLVDRAEPHLETIMPGFTHMQPAQPITLAHWLMSFFWMLQRDRERLNDSLKRINISPLGSSALAGTPYPIDREHLAANLGFASASHNSLDAVSDRDMIAEFLFITSMIGIHLSRLAEDVILYSNPIYGYIRLPDAYSTGSSIMPQKRNADPMELARGKAGRMIGNLTGLMTTLKGLPSTYNKDLQEDKEPLFDTARTLDLLLPVIAGMLNTLEFIPENMQAALDEGLLATELADWLVGQGMAFREAHHIVGQVVRRAEDKGLTLSQLPLADYQSISALFNEDVYGALDFVTAVNKRKAVGGTSPDAVRHQIARARILLSR
ncbi:MAG: argininosuccinate lyase [Chloroflexi bacterium]|nr:argininosuccinate lyase [Chloroflexota bacterium]